MANIKIKPVKSKEEWENFAAIQSPSVFTQAWNWGQFQKSRKRKVWYLGAYDKKELVGICLTHMIPTKFRTHIYTSNGPIMNWDRYLDIMPPLLDELKRLGEENDAIFVRMDPFILDTDENRQKLSQFKMKRAATNSQAEFKWILDITPEEDELLKNMKKNTRYAIRRAQKEGIKVEYSLDPKDFDNFWNLFLDTVEKQKFVPHSKSYYIDQIKSFAEDREYRIYWAHLKGKILATALIPFYGDTAYYLHAASSHEIRNVFPAHALIWQIVRDAKEAGKNYFDFWGIAPTDDPKHPWAGFTFFKKSFGGFRQDLIRGYDLPINPIRYKFVRELEKTRGLWSRGYYVLKRGLKR